MCVLLPTYPSPKYTQNLTFSLPYLVPFYRLIIIKKIGGGSSLVSLSIVSNNNVIAILYKKLDMGNWSRCGQNTKIARICNRSRKLAHLL
jgi:hypothetical protein